MAHQWRMRRPSAALSRKLNLPMMPAAFGTQRRELPSYEYRTPPDGRRNQPAFRILDSYRANTSNCKFMRRGTFGFPSNDVEEGSIGYQDLCDAVVNTEAVYQTQLAALCQEKAALMQQLLAGKRRVRLAENEVA